MCGPHVMLTDVYTITDGVAATDSQQQKHAYLLV